MLDAHALTPDVARPTVRTLADGVADFLVTMEYQMSGTPRPANWREIANSYRHPEARSLYVGRVCVMTQGDRLRSLRLSRSIEIHELLSDMGMDAEWDSVQHHLLAERDERELTQFEVQRFARFFGVDPESIHDPDAYMERTGELLPCEDAA